MQLTQPEKRFRIAPLGHLREPAGSFHRVFADILITHEQDAETKLRPNIACCRSRTELRQTAVLAVWRRSDLASSEFGCPALAEISLLEGVDVEDT